MSKSMVDLVSVAESMGLSVEWVDLGERSGELRPGRALINPRRSQLTQRAALAHECGHAAYGHDWTAAHSKARDERQADLYAARLLIDDVELRRAIVEAGPDLRSVAKELCVPARLVQLRAAEIAAKR